MANVFKKGHLMSEKPVVSSIQRDMQISGTGMRIAPRDPKTAAASIGHKSPSKYDDERVYYPVRDVKERIAYSGGFKIPEDAHEKRDRVDRDVEQYREIEQNAGKQTSALSKETIFRDLNLQMPGNYDRISSIEGQNKGILTRELIGSLSKEVGKLKRQSENIQMRKSQTAMSFGLSGGLEDRMQDLKERELTMKQELEKQEGSKVIYAGNARIQLMKSINDDDQLLKNISYDQLVQMRSQHMEKVKMLEEEYLKKKQSDVMGTSIRTRISSRMDPLQSSTYPKIKDPEIKEILDGKVLSYKSHKSPKKKELQKSIPREEEDDFERAKPMYEKKPRYAKTGMSGKKPIQKIVEEKKRVMSPERRNYEGKFEKYLGEKYKEEEFIQHVEENKRDWDKYTAGPDSPHKKGKEWKGRVDQSGEKSKCDFSNYDASAIMQEQEEDEKEDNIFKNNLNQHNKVPIPLNKEDQKIFILLRWVFNSLDIESKDSVQKEQIVQNVFKDNEIMDIFHISDKYGFQKRVESTPTENEGFLNWNEFLTVLFWEQKQQPLFSSSQKGRKSTPKKTRIPRSSSLEDVHAEMERRDSGTPKRDLIYRYGDPSPPKPKHTLADSSDKIKNANEREEGYCSDPETKQKAQLKSSSSQKIFRSSGGVGKPQQRRTKSKGKEKEEKPKWVKSWVYKENDPSLSTKRITGKDYQQHLKPKKADDGLYNITIPKPFSFNDRENLREKRINEMKLEQMLEEKETEVQNLIHHQFRANPIPERILIPRYHALMESNEARRTQVKMHSEALTKSREKPFSFYAKDKNKIVERGKFSEQHIPECMKHPAFKANKVPWESSVPLYAQMVEKEEQERKARIEERSKINLSKSKLPPRMEMHEVTKQEEKSQMLEKNKEEFSFQPMQAKEVPDFKRQQSGFQRTMEKHKKQKRLTQQKPFQFNESKKSAKNREYLDSENKTDLKYQVRKIALMGNVIDALKKPSINPPSTNATNKGMERRRKDIEEKRNKEEALMREKMDRKQKQNRLQERVKSSKALVDNSKELEEKRKGQIEDRKRAQRDQQKMYEEKKREMYEKVKQRPLLMELESKGAYNLDKMRALKKVNDTLKEAGISKTGEFFDKDEYEAIEDAQYLESRKGKR